MANDTIFSGLEQARVARGFVASAAASVSAENLAPEERAIERAIDQFFTTAPVALLFLHLVLLLWSSATF